MKVINSLIVIMKNLFKNKVFIISILLICYTIILKIIKLLIKYKKYYIQRFNAHKYLKIIQFFIIYFINAY